MYILLVVSNLERLPEAPVPVHTSLPVVLRSFSTKGWRMFRSELDVAVIVLGHGERGSAPGDLKWS